MRMRPEDPREPGSLTLSQTANYLRVDYTQHPELKMMVPKEMQERFWIPGGMGEGRARYSNFRQFATSTRVIPPADVIW